MAYCVHCGVELAASEDKCPLCKCPVMDPNPAWREPEERPYPERLEVVPPRIDRRYGAQLAALFLLIPMAAVLISNLLINHQVTWSAYVLGAIACLEVWVLLPMYLDITRPYLYIALDILSSALYLLLIAWRTGGANWYLPLALPLTFILGGSAMLSVYVCRRKQMPQLNRASLVVLIGAMALVGLEALIDLKTLRYVQLEWSAYALAPLAASAAVLRMIERKPRLKEEIQKRLFL